MCKLPPPAQIGRTSYLVPGAEFNAEQTEYLQMVKGSGALSILLNDILDFSKIEAGKLELDHQSFNLRKSLGEVVKTLWTQSRDSLSTLF
jgi:two-component system, sensor histidine kinase and response regulator